MMVLNNAVISQLKLIRPSKRKYRWEQRSEILCRPRMHHCNGHGT